jgi:uncharacterized Zn finger protein
MSYWGNFPPYVSVAEKKAKAARKREQLKKKNSNLKPILLSGSAIARTWWGKSWNTNLERYADYSNRIGRGRSYVRYGAVVDLQIDSGKVESLVQGSRSKPYSVTVKIKPIKKEIWQKIKTACEGKLDSLPELLAGKFPKALEEIFMAKGEGLFPSPKEIEFDCSCPDWAYMCKHVAAALYGIGVRLDEYPHLLFELRQAKVDDLITQAIEDKTRKLLQKAEKQSSRILAESDLSVLFGIEMEEAPTTSPGSRPRKAARKPVMQTKPKRPAKHNTAKKKSSTTTDTNHVLNIVRRSKKGVDVPTLKKKTGLNEKKIRQIVHSAFKKGIIRQAGRGIYMGE